MRQEVFNEQMETLQDYFSEKLTDRKFALYMRYLLRWNEMEFIDVVEAIIARAKDGDRVPKLGRFTDVKMMLRERRSTKAPDGNGSEPDYEGMRGFLEVMKVFADYENHRCTLAEAKRRANQHISLAQYQYEIKPGDDERWNTRHVPKGFNPGFSPTLMYHGLQRDWGGRETDKPKAEAVTETPAHVWPEEPPEVVQAIPEAVEFDLV